MTVKNIEDKIGRCVEKAEEQVDGLIVITAGGWVPFKNSKNYQPTLTYRLTGNDVGYRFQIKDCYLPEDIIIQNIVNEIKSHCK